MNGWLRRAAGGALILVRVTPNAGRDAIQAPAILADGTCVLRLRINAQPEGGRANKAAIALLAKAGGLPKSAFTVKSGATARTKTIWLQADREAIVSFQDRIGALLAQGDDAGSGPP